MGGLLILKAEASSTVHPGQGQQPYSAWEKSYEESYALLRKSWVPLPPPFFC